VTAHRKATLASQKICIFLTLVNKLTLSHMAGAGHEDSSTNCSSVTLEHFM